VIGPSAIDESLRATGFVEFLSDQLIVQEAEHVSGAESSRFCSSTLNLIM